MVYQKCTSRFVQKGRPLEGTKEIRRVKRARPQLPRPSLIKDGRAYWILNKHDLRQKCKGQTIIF